MLSFVFKIGKSQFPSVLGDSVNISTNSLLNITNQDRQEHGLSLLTLNNKLDQAATNKAADMFKKDYWAHDSPTGETPWDFITKAGYNYAYAGENLARGYSSSQSVVAAWMASPEHRTNMLSVSYKDVGFAVEQGNLTGQNTILVVEMFGSTQAEENASGNKVYLPVVQNSTPQVLPAQSVITKPIINTASLTVMVARIVLAVFITLILLDIIFIDRKTVFRDIGHNIDHIFFLSIIFLLVLILIRGSIL